MKDFLSIDIESTLSNDEVFGILSSNLPNIAWKRGDSDSQGTYVSGRQIDGVVIQCWTGEKPVAMTISFRNAAGLNEKTKDDIANVMLTDIAPRIGIVKGIAAKES
jgi:hypothetical protein